MKLDVCESIDEFVVETKQGRFIFGELEDGSLSVCVAGDDVRINPRIYQTYPYCQLTLTAVKKMPSKSNPQGSPKE